MLLECIQLWRVFAWYVLLRRLLTLVHDTSTYVIVACATVAHVTLAHVTMASVTLARVTLTCVTATCITIAWVTLGQFPLARITLTCVTDACITMAWITFGRVTIARVTLACDLNKLLLHRVTPAGVILALVTPTRVTFAFCYFEVSDGEDVRKM